MFWHDCTHFGAHFVDLTRKGAAALGITFFFGLWLGWRPCGRGP